MPQGSYFFIKSHLNGLVVAISGSGSHVQVVTWEKKATSHDTQLWYLHKDTATLRSRHKALCLHAKEDGGLQVVPYCEGVSSWSVNDCKIICEARGEKVLDIISADPNPRAALGVSDYIGGANQHWTLDYVEPPYFYIRTAMSTRVLDVFNDETAPGTKVILYQQKAYTAPNQLWYTDQQGFIRSKLNDMALQINSSTDRLCVFPHDPSCPGQQWEFDGEHIVNRSVPDKVLDVCKNQDRDSAEIIAYAPHGGANQRWTRDYA